MEAFNAKAMDALKLVLLEWIVTNGSLPGFVYRLEESKNMWDTVPSTGMIVYRGQGHTIAGIPLREAPTNLKIGVRPVLATTKTKDVAIRYMGKDCCLFEIYVSPGTQYVDTRQVFTVKDKETGLPVPEVSDTIIDRLLALTEGMPEKYWLRDAIKNGRGQHAVRKLFMKRITTEDEVLIDSSKGSFTVSPMQYKAIFTMGSTRGGNKRKTRKDRKKTRKSVGIRLVWTP